MEEEAVQTHHDLAEFVRHLLRDYQADAGTWENITLPDFLQAMSAWIDDIGGWYANRGEAIPDHPSWATFAQILGAATVYE
ncbi:MULTISPECIES: hypothetical protein [Deinococcus]|uniref:DUF7660 domain-containing protein n=1 Tax=Deinococcus rufus TaxID=2136097 RepID=A0ABV7Z646_9DEIO|nr:hypothetical protein [Deinococcus sp. AB2017081]WQE95944.1 hypothetical protein U2P90_03380 [Deinococcus sp. AB2017081]